MSATRLPPGSFLEVAPVELAFGTSGLRGLVSDITDLEAYVNVLGTLRYLLATGDIAPGATVPLGGDLRPSTDRIMAAAARAVRDAGLGVENTGKLPTPALVAHAMGRGQASVMITGSHIPFDRNGIKITKRAGEVLKSDEAGILAEVAAVRSTLYARAASDSEFDARGAWKTEAMAPPPGPAAEDGYVRRYTSAFRARGLEGLRVLVYQHSAVGRDLVVRILSELGAEAIPVDRSETFVPIDTENIADADLDRLDRAVRTVEAERGAVHAVVSTDGDSDRPLCVAVLPASSSAERRVRFLPGDLLGIVVAEYLEADAVVVPVSSNDAVERRMRERGVAFAKTKIGSPFVIAALDRIVQAGSAARPVGWEANGGFLTAKDLELAAGVLPALPTRDAVLPILANLYAAVDAKTDLASVWSKLPPRFGRAGLRDGVPTQASKAILSALVPPGDLTEAVFAEDGSARSASGVALPAETASAFERARDTVARFFGARNGFGPIEKIDVLDGVRVTFAGGDVAHVRPSGNAPQLRIYANADTQPRANAIVADALAEPAGVLSELIQAFSQSC